MNKRLIVEGYQPSRSAESLVKRDTATGRFMETGKRSASGPPASVRLPKTTSSVNIPKK